MDFNPLMASFSVLIWASLEERWGPLESVAEVQFFQVSFTSLKLWRSRTAPPASCCALPKLTVGVLRDPTVNAALRNLSSNKSSEEEKKDKATHSQKGKV